MAEAAPAGRGCLKRGCIGCLVVAGIGLAAVTVLALVLILRGSPAPIPETARRAHDIPHAESALEPDATQPGRVILDVRMANLSIIPAPAGTPLRLEAHYNSASYELTETFESAEETGWMYRLGLDSRRFQLFHIDPDNHLELYLPMDTRITLEGELGLGKFQIELGGLRVERVELDTGIGEHDIAFSEPLVEPMTRFEVHASMGGLRVHQLGNASPVDAEIRHRMGSLYVDLDGAWRRDAAVTVGQSFGSLRIGAPPVGIGFEWDVPMVHQSEMQGQQTRPEPAPGAPVVRFKASHSFGEFRLVD